MWAPYMYSSVPRQEVPFCHRLRPTHRPSEPLSAGSTVVYWYIAACVAGRSAAELSLVNTNRKSDIERAAERAIRRLEAAGFATHSSHPNQLHL